MNLRFLKRKLPHILTALTCIGVVGTGVTCVRATWNAKDILREEEKRLGHELSSKEKIKVLAPHYILPVTVTAATLASCLGNHAVNKRQKTAILTACLSYREALKQAINGLPEKEKIVIKKPEGELNSKDTEMYYEPFSKIYVYKTEAQMAHIELELNKIFHDCRVVTMDDYYDLLEVMPLAQAKKVSPSGFFWSKDLMTELHDRSWIEMFYIEEENKDGMKFKTINFSIPPIFDYDLTY